jgi:hypothetical protein
MNLCLAPMAPVAAAADTPSAGKRPALTIWNRGAAARRGPDAPGTDQRVVADGILLGTAEIHPLGVRFAAIDARVAEMDQSIWPNADYAVRSARQLLRTESAAARLPR